MCIIWFVFLELDGVSMYCIKVFGFMPALIFFSFKTSVIFNCSCSGQKESTPRVSLSEAMTRREYIAWYAFDVVS